MTPKGLLAYVLTGPILVLDTFSVRSIATVSRVYLTAGMTADSRFLMAPEQRYVAIEGEALTVAWALEQTRYFTLGCEELIVATDHKPLVGIFENKELSQITNPRIFRLKQRTLWWTFQMVYLPGRTNLAADAVSRHPSPSGTQTADMMSVGAEALSQYPSPNGEFSDGNLADITLIGSEKRASMCSPILWQEVVSVKAAYHCFAN